MPAGHEPDIAVAQLEAAVERRHHEVDLAAADPVAVGPAVDAPVAPAGVQREMHVTLIEAHQRDRSAYRLPRRAMAVNPGDGGPAPGESRGPRNDEMAHGPA